MRNSCFCCRICCCQQIRFVIYNAHDSVSSFSTEKSRLYSQLIRRMFEGVLHQSRRVHTNFSRNCRALWEDTPHLRYNCNWLQYVWKLLFQLALINSIIISNHQYCVLRFNSLSWDESSLFEKEEFCFLNPWRFSFICIGYFPFYSDCLLTLVSLCSLPFLLFRSILMIFCLV